MRMLADVALIGFIMALASVPLALGWVPRNRVYGFRVGATLRDDRVWYATNRRMGVEMIVIGLALWGVTELLGRAGMDEGTAGRIAWVTLIVAIALFIVRGWKYANRVARQTPRAR